MKYIFILPRYPTEKAYGVTSGNTAKALAEIGNEVEIWSVSNCGIDEYGNKVRNLKSISLTATRILEFISLRLTHLIKSFVTVVQVKKLASDEDAILVIRDILQTSLLFLIRPKSRIILEIHHPPTLGSTKRMLRFLSRRSNIKICTITPRHSLILQELGIVCKITILGMGVSSNFFRNFRTWEKAGNTVNIGFIGKEQSSGENNGIVEICNLLNLAASKTYLIVQFTIVGFMPQFLQGFKHNLNLVNNFKIKSIPHIRHQDIPSVLSKFHAGVIPYPANNYNTNRFPIKALEYSASSIPILVNENAVYRKLFPKNGVHFYRSEKEISVFLDQISSGDPAIQNMVTIMQDWARIFSYEKRANEIAKIVF
jgi:hypothetical protein